MTENTLSNFTITAEQPSVEPLMNLFLTNEHAAAYPEPSAKSGGVSFKASQFVISTAITAVMGTSPLTGATPMTPLQNVTIAIPLMASTAMNTERYERRRREMVAAGIPFLTDEALREEIHDRKGIREP